MCKRISLIMLLVFVTFSFGFNPRLAKPQKLEKAPRLIESNSTSVSSDKIYDGITYSNFDKSSNGYGWNLGYNRKIQAFFDPTYGEMYGSIYRQRNNESGSGTIGGMIGKDDGYPDSPSFNNFTQTIYSNSIYQFGDSLPGGQYPYACEFINGYFFGLFNDEDMSYSYLPESQSMFTVADATFGYDFTSWSEPKRIEANDGTTIYNAWQGTGDVVYDPASGYYYWSQAWREGQYGMDDTIISCVVGKSSNPADENSWVWTDHSDLRFDANYASGKASELEEIGDFYFSYGKDTHGNGSGKGIGLAMTRNYDQNNPRLSYIYTPHWGGVLMDSSGFVSSWLTDGGNMFQIPMDELFDWYGETLTFNDSIGFDLETQQVIYDSLSVIMDEPFIAWNTSVVTTEYDQVYVLIKVFPASTQYPGVIFPWTDNGFRAGYYMVKGTLSGTGVTWQPATLVANFIDNNKGWKTEDQGMEWKYANRNTLSLCNLGYGQLLASWLDKPISRAIYFDYENANNKFYDDGYLIFTYNDGNSWEHDSVVEIETGIPEDPIWYLKYAGNATKTGTLHEDGWTLSSTGKIYGQFAYTFAASQFMDNVAVIPPILDANDFQQFLHVWKVYYQTSGIQVDEVSIAKEFELSQNYPNPFNPETVINFQLKNNADVKLSVFNTKGELVSVLKDDKMTKGSHSVNFNAKDLNSGMYFYTLKVNNRSESKKMILVK